MDTATLQLGLIHKGFLEDAEDGDPRVFFVKLGKVTARHTPLRTPTFRRQKNRTRTLHSHPG